MANIRRWQHIVGGSTHSFNFSTKNSASLSALMSVEVDTAHRPLSRDKTDENNRVYICFLI